MSHSNVSDLCRAQVNTASRLHGAAAGVDLTRVDRDADKAIAVITTLTAALKLSRTSHCTFGVLVARRIGRRATINGCKLQSYIHS